MGKLSTLVSAGLRHRISGSCRSKWHRSSFRSSMRNDVSTRSTTGEANDVTEVFYEPSIASENPDPAEDGACSYSVFEYFWHLYFHLGTFGCPKTRISEIPPINPRSDVKRLSWHGAFCSTTRHCFPTLPFKIVQNPAKSSPDNVKTILFQGTLTDGIRAKSTCHRSTAGNLRKRQK